MPAPAIKSFAPKYAKREKITLKTAKNKLTKMWDRAKTIAGKKGLTEGTDQFYAYVFGIWKRMSGFRAAASSMRIAISMNMANHENPLTLHMHDAPVLKYKQDDYDDGVQSVYVEREIEGEVLGFKETWEWDRERFRAFDEFQRSCDDTKAIYARMCSEAKRTKCTILR